MTENLLKTPKYWLTLDDCEMLLRDFKDLLAREEPIPPFKDRFEGKLEGILGSVKQTYDSTYLNPSVLDAASAYFNQLIRGHAFENGNKRLAVLYTHWFLLSNQVELTLTPSEFYSFAVSVAKAGKLDIKPEITKDWCKEVLQKFTKSLQINQS